MAEPTTKEIREMLAYLRRKGADGHNDYVEFEKRSMTKTWRCGWFGDDAEIIVYASKTKRAAVATLYRAVKAMRGEA